jgi:hypothetical protein
MQNGRVAAGGGGGKGRRTTTEDTSKKQNGAPRPRNVVPIEQVLASSAPLRERLASLGATTLPWYVVEKHLKASDVHRNQARLLFSCKSSGRPLSPLASCFTDAEARRVVGEKDGLLLTALDRAGRSYDLTCKYLYSNHGYRFITGWKPFLEANGLLLDDKDGGTFQRDVYVELWAFRSPALPNGFIYVEDEETKKKNKKKVREDTGHPDGSLGVVLLHYEYNAVEDVAVDDLGTVMPAEVVTGQEVVVPAGDAGSEQGTTRVMTKDEMVEKYGGKTALAAIGMYMLRTTRGGST